MEKKELYLISIIIGLTLIIRLIIAFSNPTFTYDSYFNLYQAQNILEDGTPKFNDPLSYGGRTLFFLPFFQYLIALFAIIFPLELIAKIIPNLLISTLPLIVFLISKKITQDTNSSLLSALIVSIVPALFTPLSLNIDSLLLPTLSLAILMFLYWKKNIYLYIGTLLIASLTSYFTSLLLIGLLIYLVLSSLEGKKILKAEKELTLFSFFLFLWIQFIFFKNTLIKEGIGFIWQNIPPQIIQNYFPKLTIGKTILFISPIPIIIALYITFQTLFQKRNKDLFLIISFVISTTLLTSSQLIPIKISLAFLSILAAILFAQFFKQLIIFLRKTKIAKHQNLITILTIIILLATILPFSLSNALNENTPSIQEINGFSWLKNNTEKNSAIASLLEEGHLINYAGSRKNIMDEKFNAINDIEQRFNDLNLIFTTPFSTKALHLLEKYNIDYIIFTPKAKEKFHKLKYLSKDCFEQVYNKEKVKIYKVTCTIKPLE